MLCVSGVSNDATGERNRLRPVAVQNYTVKSNCKKGREKNK